MLKRLSYLFMVFLLVFACVSCAKRSREAPASKEFAPGASPRQTVESYIEFKSQKIATSPRSKANANVRGKFLTKKSASAVEKLNSRQKETIVEIKNQAANSAEVLTKKELLGIDTVTGEPAPTGDYIECLYRLRPEDGLWKIENILTRTRGSDEFPGFAPKWRSGMNELR